MKKKKTAEAKPRHYIPLKSKLDIIKKNEEGTSNASIAAELNIEESIIEKIIRRANRFKNKSPLTPRTNSEAKETKIAMMNELETSLVNWIEEIKDEGNLTSDEIRNKALKDFSALKKKTEYKKHAKEIKFLASEAWYYKFRKRLSHLDVKIKRK